MDLGKIVNVTLGGIFYLVALIGGFLFIMRRHQEPIRSRSWEMAVFQVAMVVLDIIIRLCGEDLISCFVRTSEYFLILPLWIYPYFLRCLILFLRSHSQLYMLKESHKNNPFNYAKAAKTLRESLRKEKKEREKKEKEEKEREEREKRATTMDQNRGVYRGPSIEISMAEDGEDIEIPTSKPPLKPMISLSSQYSAGLTPSPSHSASLSQVVNSSNRNSAELGPPKDGIPIGNISNLSITGQHTPSPSKDNLSILSGISSHSAYSGHSGNSGQHSAHSPDAKSLDDFEGSVPNNAVHADEKTASLRKSSPNSHGKKVIESDDDHSNGDPSLDCLSTLAEFNEKVREKIFIFLSRKSNFIFSPAFQITGVVFFFVTTFPVILLYYFLDKRDDDPCAYYHMFGFQIFQAALGIVSLLVFIYLLWNVQDGYLVKSEMSAVVLFGLPVLVLWALSISFNWPEEYGANVWVTILQILLTIFAFWLPVWGTFRFNKILGSDVNNGNNASFGSLHRKKKRNTGLSRESVQGTSENATSINMSNQAKLEQGNLDLKPNFDDEFFFAIYDPDLGVSFEKFATQTWALENLLFLRAVNGYRFGPEANLFREFEFIYHQFVEIGSMCEINVDQSVRENITERYHEKQIDRNIFLPAFEEACNLLKFHVFPLWKSNNMYNDVLKRLKVADIQVLMLQRSQARSRSVSLGSRYSVGELVVQQQS